MNAYLFDAFGRPVQGSGIRRPDLRELSTVSVRDRWSSYPSSGLTPERLAGIFRLADNGDVLRQAELFEEIEEKDAHISSQFQIRKLSVQGLDWEIIPAGEDARSKEVAVFCRGALESLPDLDEHVLDLLDAIAKGYSVMEILWEASGKEVAIGGLRWIHPKKTTFWNSMTPRVLTDEEPARGVDPPPFKIVYHRYKARSGYDARGGVLRVCAWMYLFKNYAIKDWVAFAEVYGMPLRVGKYDPGAGKADKEALIHAVRSLGADAAGIISKSTEIEFIESQKTSSLNIYEDLARFCDAQASKAILGQTLTSEAGGAKGSGSYALGRVHGDVRQDLTEADCRALGKTLTHQVLRPLVGFNFGWDAPPPKFRFKFERPEDLKAAAETYKILVDMGFDVSGEHISERFKVPLRKENEHPLMRQAGGTRRVESETRDRDDDRFEPAEDAERKSAKVSAGDPGQEFIDALAEKMNQAEGMLDPAMRDLIPVIQSAGSFEEILEEIYARFGSLDTSNLQELVERAAFAARVMGFLQAKEEARG